MSRTLEIIKCCQEANCLFLWPMALTIHDNNPGFSHIITM